MAANTGVVKSCTDFWSRRLSLSLSAFPDRNDSWWGTDQDAGDVERRRVRAWTASFYGGPVRTPRLELQPVLDFIAETARSSAAAGHRVEERMFATIPVELHRLWCVGLVAPTDGSGWPMWAGISVTAEVYLQAPRGWVQGMAVGEADDDMVEVWARDHGDAIARRFWLPADADPAAERIYEQLREDMEMSPEDAAEAAQLLASIGEPPSHSAGRP